MYKLKRQTLKGEKTELTNLQMLAIILGVLELLAISAVMGTKHPFDTVFETARNLAITISVVGVAYVIYFLPTILLWRDKDYKHSLFHINLLFGWIPPIWIWLLYTFVVIRFSKLWSKHRK